jgi:NSS family neurotransmitter:Na+ symporter
MKRVHWKSRFGFIWAAVGSAVGLGNIWRFPYIVGENGGAVFVLLYIICLLLVGLPILIAEIAIGRKTQQNPGSAFKELGKSPLWEKIGKMTIITGLLVSAFYGVVAAWTFSYLVESLMGRITHFTSPESALAHFQRMISTPSLALTAYCGFMLLCLGILLLGVRKGIEGSNKIFMPLLLLVLIALSIKGILLPGAATGLKFLFKPNLALITPKVILMALSQAFFALSLGQGTMITYGSYLTEKENVPSTCFPIALFGTFVSIFAGIAIFSIVFSAGLEPTAGEGLMFQTLPYIFSHMALGGLLAFLFFLLIFLAGLTSQISALEPFIAYLIDRKMWPRRRATLMATGLSFCMGIPCALSFGPLKGWTLFGRNIFDLISSLSVTILIPLGGLAAALLVGWRYGIAKTLNHLSEGAPLLKSKRSWMRSYLKWGIRYIAPLIIAIVFVHQLFYS